MSTCKGCLHRNRDQLDAQLIAGTSYRSIGQTFGLSLGAIHRHRAHVVAMVRELPQAERAERGSALMTRVENLLTDAEQILARAKVGDDLRAATAAVNAVAKVLELLGRASGELQAPGAGVHFHTTRISKTVNLINDDTEVAMLFAEFTRNFDEGEIQRLKVLVSVQAQS